MATGERRHVDAPGGGQPDRDRILYSPEFRRLAAVTQVAVAEGGLLFHNRLTHSLKVAHIALRLARKLNEEQSEFAKAHGGIDLDVVESAALAHDLGHPPFGHVTERKLDELMKPTVMDGFEGNAQAFRIVAKTAVHRKGHDGLNLTRETLCAILKYPWHRSTEVKDKKHGKWGAYHSEKDDFKFAREFHRNGSETPCVEAQIMTWADDITYSVHDVEDFYQAGLIPLDRLLGDREMERFLAGVSGRWQRKGIKSSYSMNELGEALKKLLGFWHLPEPYTGERRQQAALRSFTQSLIDNYITGTRLRDPQSPGEALTRSDNLLMEVEILKELLWFYVIKNPALATQEYGQGQMIDRLFQIVVGAASENKPDRWNILPGRARELLSELGANASNEERQRIAVDTIAGMTEQQVLQMFHRLTGISPGSLFQPIVM